MGVVAAEQFPSTAAKQRKPLRLESNDGATACGWLDGVGFSEREIEARKNLLVGFCDVLIRGSTVFRLPAVDQQAAWC